MIHRDPLSRGLVHQVQADHRSFRDLQHLEHEVEIALEHGGVDDDQRAVGTAEEDEVPGDLLVDGRRQQGIRAGQVDHLVPVAVELEAALGPVHRLPGPVPRMLLQSGQGVEDRALSHVRVPRQGDDIVPPVQRYAHLHQVLLQRARRAVVTGRCVTGWCGRFLGCAGCSGRCGVGTHASISCSFRGALSIRIRSDCSRRSAIIVLRTR